MKRKIFIFLSRIIMFMLSVPIGILFTGWFAVLSWTISPDDITSILKESPFNIKDISKKLKSKSEDNK